MRMWHYKLLPYLPDKQFMEQLRELIAIKRNWEKNGTPNHILVNKVIEYPKSHFNSYFEMCCDEYERRYGKKVKNEYVKEIDKFCDYTRMYGYGLFSGWHNNTYLKICMVNMHEKYICSGLSKEEWNILRNGYEKIMGMGYAL